MAGLLNLCSLLFGIAAWVLPVIGLFRHKKSDGNNLVVLTRASLTSCATTLFLQIVKAGYLVKIGDWSALEDTWDAVVVLSAVLLVVTIVLNGVVLTLHRLKNINAG